MKPQKLWLIYQMNLRIFFWNFVLEAQWKELFSINGYAFIKDTDATNNQTYVVLKSLTNQYVFEAIESYRDNLEKTYKGYGKDLNSAGFYSNFSVNRLEPGLYQIGAYVINGEEKAVGFTDSYVFLSEVSKPQYMDKIAEVREVSIPNIDENVEYWFDSIIENECFITFSGWAFVKGHDAVAPQIYLYFANEEETAVFDMVESQKPGITAHFDSYGLNLDASGFSAIINKEFLPQGDYQIGIYIQGEGYEGKVVTDVDDKPERDWNSTSDIEENVQYNFDLQIEKDSYIILRGWAFVTGRDAANPEIWLLFTSEDSKFVFDTVELQRPGVTDFFGSDTLDLDSSGFRVTIIKDDLPPGDYQVSIILLGEGYEGFVVTDLEIIID